MELTQIQIRRRTAKGGHWFYTHNKLFSIQYKKSRKPYFIAVYTCLAEHANSRTQVCFPSQKRIARMTGMSERMVRRIIKDLCDRHLMVTVKEGKRNEYLLTHPSEWVTHKAYGACERRTRVPPNKTPGDNINKKRTEILDARKRLITTMRISNYQNNFS